MIGKITSLRHGPERNVRLVVTPTEVCSEISLPSGSFDPRSIDYYELSGLQEHESGPVTLTFVLVGQRRVQFYSTLSKFDIALLLDQLDGTIGARRRELLP